MNIRIEFADAETGYSVWSNKFILPYEEANIFSLQSDIAQRVLAFFNEASNNKIGASKSINLESYGHYIKGLEWLNKNSELESRLKGIDEFEKAIMLDSGHTDSWIQLIAFKSFLIFNGDKIAKYLPEIESHIAELSDNHPLWAIELAKGIYQYHALGNYDKGFERFKNVLREYPDNEIANNLIANIYKRKLN